jgi:hypothetical protein
VLNSGISKDSGTVLGERYSKINVPLQREDGTEVCDVSANTDLKYIRRVSKSNRTRIASIYFLHSSDVTANNRFGLTNIKCYTYNYNWEVMQFITSTATLNQVDFYTGYMHSYSNLVTNAASSTYSITLSALGSSNFYYSNPNG